MSHQRREPTASGTEELTPEARARRESGIRMMVLAAVLAVLAPPGGFLAGAVVVLLGLLRWSHATRHQQPQP